MDPAEARCASAILHSAQFCSEHHTLHNPLQVERAVGLIDGIIQEDAFKAMLDDFAAKGAVSVEPIPY